MKLLHPHMFQASLYKNLFVPNGSISTPRSRLAVYKCPKVYLATFYEKDINFSNCTNMGNKRDTVILKLNTFMLADFKFST
jgi:hypothetical protein